MFWKQPSMQRLQLKWRLAALTAAFRKWLPRVKCLLLLARGPAARQLQPGLPQSLFSGMTLLCLLWRCEWAAGPECPFSGGWGWEWGAASSGPAPTVSNKPWSCWKGNMGSHCCMNCCLFQSSYALQSVGKAEMERGIGASQICFPPQREGLKAKSFRSCNNEPSWPMEGVCVQYGIPVFLLEFYSRLCLFMQDKWGPGLVFLPLCNWRTSGMSQDVSLSGLGQDWECLNSRVIPDNFMWC